MASIPIVLFGNGKIAEVLLFYFQNHSNYEVVACTVDSEFVKEQIWQDLPLISFDEIEKKYSPESHKMFVALGYQDLNGLRKQKYYEAKDKGYELISYVHPDSGLPEDCKFGDNCFIMQNSLIHPHVKLGKNVFVWSGAMIGHHSKIGDHCWITSCAKLASDVFIGNNSFVGINATISENVNIGRNCLLGANSFITKCTDENEVYLEERSKRFRLESHQFIRLSNNFGN